jgi:hypothetical protein
MPLIDVTRRPSYVFPEAVGYLGGTEMARQVTTDFFQTVFAPAIPKLFAQNSADFGMDHDTPEDGVQVQLHEYGMFDVNVADIWIKVQFSDPYPGRGEASRIRDAVNDAIVELFHTHGLNAPDNYILDVFWGPSHGCGSVNGTYIEW